MKEFVVILLMIAKTLGGFSQVGRLQVGDSAPALHVSQWIYGEPMGTFDPGMVYLVEFTHLYCKPCREAIPHLTKLAREYQDKLKVVSVYSYFPKENRNELEYQQEILKLKEMMGDEMEYSIALDTREATSNTTWNDRKGFPHVYLVDQRGSVAWMGLVNFAVLDYFVGSVVGNTGHDGALQQRYDDYLSVYGLVMKTLGTAPIDVQLRHVDNLVIGYPEQIETTLSLRLKVLLYYDVSRANVFLKRVQQERPHWKFDYRMLLDKKANGLDTASVMENFDRELVGRRDSLAVASILLAKARFLVTNGNAVDALALLDEVEYLRYKIGLVSSVIEAELMGWRQLGMYMAMYARNADAAWRWLSRQLQNRSLSQYAAIGFTTLFKDKLPPDQLETLRMYVRKKHQN